MNIVSGSQSRITYIHLNFTADELTQLFGDASLENQHVAAQGSWNAGISLVADGTRPKTTQRAWGGGKMPVGYRARQKLYKSEKYQTYYIKFPIHILSGAPLRKFSAFTVNPLMLENSKIHVVLPTIVSQSDEKPTRKSKKWKKSGNALFQQQAIASPIAKPLPTHDISIDTCVKVLNQYLSENSLVYVQSGEHLLKVIKLVRVKLSE